MSKWLQVSLPEREMAHIQRLAQRERLTVGQWVRRTLREASAQKPAHDAELKFKAVRRAAKHSFPSADLERMGDLAHHVAKQARMRYPNCAVPPELTETIISMGRVANAIIDKLAVSMEHRDTVRALEIETDDDEMDALHRKLIAALLDSNWAHGIEAAIDMTLIGRYYERCADHAVSIARRVYFSVTGEYVEIQD